MSELKTESFSAGHRWAGWVNFICATGAVLLLAVVLNYLSHHHYTRKIWAHNLERELSPRTLQLLTEISDDVEVIVFFDRTETTFRMVDELLQKYAHRNPRIKIRSVDPLEQPREALEVLSTYRLTAQQRNVVIFSANQQHKIVSNGQLSQMAPRQVSAEELSQLRGEETDEGGFVMERNGKFGQLLGEMNVRVSDLELNRAAAVPDNCDLLILSGPKTELNTKEQHMVDQYLKQGGRLLMLVGDRSEGGMSDLLQRWGLNVGQNTVIDAENTLGDGSLTLREYWVHPVVQSLQREDIPVRLLLPRTVSGLPGNSAIAAGLQVTPLMYTGEHGEAWRNYLHRTPGVEPTREHVGRLPVAVAVERDTLADVKSDHLARLVVVGDSTFLSNRMIHIEGNRELAWHSVNWLLDRSNLLQGIGPQPIKTYRFEFKANAFGKMAGLIAVIMPAGTLLLGGFIWLRRRT